jgi:hypothetical protein
MMKVAIAGSNGLAQYIGHFIETTTSHQFILLSRRVSSTVCAWSTLTANQTRKTKVSRSEDGKSSSPTIRTQQTFNSSSQASTW